ncbi:MAG: hypothetical protein RIM72_22410 [Alphaproteobacteria bacterium]
MKESPVRIVISGLFLTCAVLTVPAKVHASPLTAPANGAGILTENFSSASIRKVANEENEEEIQRTVWNSIKDTDSAALIEAYLISYPDSIFAPRARKMLDGLQATNQASPPSISSTQTTDIRAFDGKWTLTATHLYGPHAQIPFCRSGETMRTTFTVDNGEFRHQARTSKGAQVNIEGTLSETGKLDLVIIPWGSNAGGGFDANVKLGNLRIQEKLRDKRRVRAITGDDCKVELVLTRR